MFELFSEPWPWYVAGPAIGLVVPMLLLFRGKQFGVSANLRHMCAAVLPSTKVSFLQYDWKRAGLWNLTMTAGIILGAFLAATFLNGGAHVPISDATIADLAVLGINDISGLVPSQIFSLEGLMTIPGFISLIFGGFMVGFGARYAGGCTSGHAISGLANLQLPSLIAVFGFFAGGLFATFILLPLIFS